MNLLNRRDFIKLSLGGACVLPAQIPAIFSPQSEKITEKNGMIYRKLGRTGIDISEISLGGSPLPDWVLFREIIDKGVNYIDTSATYQGGNSERQIGRLFKEARRDKIHVATKFHLRGSWSVESIIKSVEGSLKRLGSDYIDVLMIHGAENPAHLTDQRVLEAFQRMKKEGKYRFSGLSCHANHREVVETAAGCGLYDVIQLGYNVYDIEKEEDPIKTYPDYLQTSGLRSMISLASSKGMGVIAMKALKVGGRRQDISKYITPEGTIYQAMLKWVLANPYIASVVTEILNFSQMEEDLSIPGKSLTSSEKKALYRMVAETSRNYCHMCGTCQKACPQNIPTTDVLRFLSYFDGQGKKNLARRQYNNLMKKGNTCRDCGACEEVCPYNLPVRQLLRKAKFHLA